MALTLSWSWNTLWPFKSHASAESGPPLLYCRGLDKNSSLTRGVGLMWRNTLNANFISCISSDQICGIRVKLSSSEPAELTILRVYLPCADLGLETYCKHLESLISEGQKPGPVLIAGDFNAHQSWVHWVVSEDKASPTCRESSQSSSLTDVSLHAVSLFSLSEGPLYTFWNSEVQNCTANEEVQLFDWRFK